MMKLTKKEALFMTRKIWLILADNPKFIKEQVSEAIGYVHNCPCCEYVNQQTGRSSLKMQYTHCKKHCPMYEAWGNKFCEYVGPDDTPSAYEMWDKAYMGGDLLYDKEFFARLIVEWAQYLIEKEWERESLEAELQLEQEEQQGKW